MKPLVHTRTAENPPGSPNGVETQTPQKIREAFGGPTNHSTWIATRYKSWCVIRSKQNWKLPWVMSAHPFQPQRGCGPNFVAADVRRLRLVFPPFDSQPLTVLKTGRAPQRQRRVSYQPGATPQVSGSQTSRGLKARSNDLFESQGGSVLQPKVATERLPWAIRPPIHSNRNAVVALNRYDHPGRAPVRFGQGQTQIPLPSFIHELPGERSAPMGTICRIHIGSPKYPILGIPEFLESLGTGMTGFPRYCFITGCIMELPLFPWHQPPDEGHNRRTGKKQPVAMASLRRANLSVHPPASGTFAVRPQPPVD